MLMTWLRAWMQIDYSSQFKRNYKKKILKKFLEDTFQEKLTLFIKDPFHNNLKTHKLSGEFKDCWAFSVEYDCRVIFKFLNEDKTKVLFVNVGKHDEVY